MSEDSLSRSLESAVRIADGAGVRALVLVGSLARGEGTRWSDIDLGRWVDEDMSVPDTVARYIDGRLLLISTSTVSDVREQLESPADALWAVPAFLSMRILLDRGGDAAKVRDLAERFSWESLRPAADVFIETTAAKSAEYVLKINSATERRDEPAALHAAAALLGRCPRIVSVAKGTFIKTENEYYRVVCDAAGPTWTKALRGAFGLEEAHDAFAQAASACVLYRETVALVRDRLSAAAREVVERTLTMVPA